MRPAQYLTTEQISDELDMLAAQWREVRDDDEGHAGSPGEWLVERMDELDAEMERRRAAGNAAPDPRKP